MTPWWQTLAAIARLAAQLRALQVILAEDREVFEGLARR